LNVNYKVFESIQILDLDVVGKGDGNPFSYPTWKKNGIAFADNPVH
jgi:hypothetical protein